jgi:DNA protecting protein DprA
MKTSWFEITPKTHPKLKHLWLGDEEQLQLHASKLWIEAQREESLTLLESLPDQGFGVIGTRVPNPRSLFHMRRIFERLTSRRSDAFQLTILSGLARGVDAWAHEEALRAQFPTIAILAHGLDTTYPPEHESLRQRILENRGLMITEFPPGTLPSPKHFLRRNRWIASLSRALWVAQAPYRSGALNTARWARELDRTVFVTPSFPEDPDFSGSQRLLVDEEALPLYEAYQLGSVWSPFASLPPLHRKRSPSAPFHAPVPML